MNRRIRFDAWCSTADLTTGTHDGTTVTDGLLRFGSPSGLREYDDPHGHPPTRYETATWTSPSVTPGFAASELVPSWNADTPPGTWLEVSLCITTGSGEQTGWYVLGRWAAQDTDIHPSSVPDQADELASVEVDRLCVHGELASYRLRVTLLRRTGSSSVTPSVSLLGVVASQVPSEAPAQVSAFGLGRAVLVDVPPYSQMLHRGEYPQWDAGGESWCSPTSTTMLLARWGRGPAPADYAWVDEGYADRFIDYAARHTFDHSYKGAGNWPFNTAYAARFGVRAYVTRLRDLTEAERFLAAGVPLVATVAFEKGALEGAGYDTQGHLLTIIGFDEHGNVVSNDPASHGVASNDEVRTTYDRAQFERTWLGSAGGLVYVIHPFDVPLPDPDPAEPHWLPTR